MTKNVVLVSGFGVMGLCTLLLSLVFVFRLDTRSADTGHVKIMGMETLLGENIGLSERIIVESGDGRSLLVENYLKKYDSPLLPFAAEIIAVSDKYGLDYRLLPAIARQESNLCKRIPSNSYNCWGFGIYGDLVTRFDNYSQALDIVAKTLKRDYLDKGLDTPFKIMAKYTPPSVELGGPWAKGVSQFLEDLE